MLLYFISPSINWRNGELLVFSLIFYSWGEPKLVLLMLATVAVNYAFGLLVERYRGRPAAKLFLALAVLVSLGSLAVFKYAGFFVSSLNSVLGAGMTVPSIALPIGISFYTFQILTYVIDVYRGSVPAQRSFFRLLLYISCFHQLIAGPIVRYEDIARELEHRRTSPDEISYGIRRFIIGFAKKVVIANMCGETASQILDSDVASITVAGAWFGVIIFSLQIYFDFSAYSDMAIGMGRMCGFHYKENFDYPYVSRSVTEFWRRWHISLGSFFRDYVYIPLGGNRRHQLLNLFIVWSLTGLWHGASWNFALWGIYFFVFIALEKFVYGKVLEHLPVISNLYLLAVVAVGWVFFYYTDVSQAFALLSVMFGAAGNPVSDSLVMVTIQSNFVLLNLAVLCCIPFGRLFKGLFDGGGRRTRAGRLADSRAVSGLSLALSTVVCAVLLMVSTVMLVGESYNPFLYFRF